MPKISIDKVFDHYEVSIDGEFEFSCDTYHEAAQELEERGVLI